jgi:hypothetical protein
MTFINARDTHACHERFDHSDLDGHLLQLLLAVHEEQSVTRAARAPGRHAVGREPPAGQAARHRRRPAVREAPAVASCPPRAPTRWPCAPAAAGRPARFRHPGQLRPGHAAQATFTIAANDLQRDLLLPALLRRLRAQAPGVALRVIRLRRAARRDAARATPASW